MYDGFVARAETVTRLLSDRRTTFVVISTLEATPVREAEFFGPSWSGATSPGRNRAQQGAPSYFARRRTSQWRKPWPSAQGPRRAPGRGPALAARVLSDVAESFLNFSVVARREAEQQDELSTSAEVLATVPFFDADIADMEGLLRLGEKLWT